MKILYLKKSERYLDIILRVGFVLVLVYVRLKSIISIFKKNRS